VATEDVELIELRYCYGCGTVKVTFADVEDCAICRKPTTLTPILAAYDPERRRIAFGCVVVERRKP
jgi:hypothetical protein